MFKFPSKHLCAQLHRHPCRLPSLASHHRRFDRRLANVMSWRLIHELKARGDLLMGEDADIGQTKGKAPNMRPVDRYGLPLWRIKVED